MKKLRNLILIMVCITLTVTALPSIEDYPIAPHGHHDQNQDK